MGETSHPPGELQTWIDRLQKGDPTAREQLLGQACERLRRLTRKMLKGFARVQRWEQTDDVLQNALVRLWKALAEVTPRSARDFYALAALQIRRELIDLARQHFGPEGMGANQASNAASDGSASMPLALSEKADNTQEPSRLAMWSEFHQHVDRLPEEEREVFDLLWYQELTQAEAAGLLGISEATLKRRWLSARRRLHDMLRGQLPGN
jgi:RNA polymerase sigma-70 factor (ECF subfamily)